MSCVGPVMYQPYSSTAPPSSAAASLFSVGASPPAPSSVSPAHPGHGHPLAPSQLAHLSYPLPQEHIPLPLKRELVEKHYKVEAQGDPLGPDSRLGAPENRLGDHSFPSPPQQNMGPSSVGGSCGTPGPRTPVTPRPSSQQERESDGEMEDLPTRTAVYLNRNVILYTHYIGEVASIVDDHFTKALNQAGENFQQSKGTPMASRNLPPSFFNANYNTKYGNPGSVITSEGGPGAVSGLYPDYTQSSLHHLAGSPDPWQYAAQASANSPYHRTVADLVNSASSSQHYSSQASSLQAAQNRLQSQYSSLFLGAASSPALSRHSAATMVSVKSEAPWGGSSGNQDYHSASVPEFSHPLDRNYSPHAYTNMATGIEGVSQDQSKDLYWPTF